MDAFRWLIIIQSSAQSARSVSPGIVVCPFCNIPLTLNATLKMNLVEIPEPVILGDDLSSLKELRTAGVDWIHHLQDNLAEAGIPHRIEQSHPPRIAFLGLRSARRPAAGKRYR